MTNTELEIMLRLPHIMRWQIVRTLKNQSVAEHSYRVWLLATHLYDTLFPVPHNSFERDSVQLWALIHDVDEVLTGDIPSTVKGMLEEISPGILSRFADRVMVDLPIASETRKGIKGTLGELIVKVADNVEAILYLRDYGLGDCSMVIQTRVDVLRALTVSLMQHNNINVASVIDWINNLTEANI